MLPWKRNRSRENNHEVESMETNKNSKLGSKNNFSRRSFLGLSSRVFSGQFLSNVCNSFKTMTHPTNPSKVNIMTNSSSTSSQRLASPTKMLKRWVPNNTELGLGLATSMTDDLELGLGLGLESGSGSGSGRNHDNAYKTGKNVIHRSTMMLFNDNILSHSSSKSNFEDDIGGKSMCRLTLGIEGPSDHMVMNNSKTFTRLQPSDQYDRNVDEVRHFEEENANAGVVFFSPVASPKEANIFPPIEFLKYCHFCKNELDHRKDIFMYRGEKAFCSEECREEEIHFDAIRSKRKRSARQAAKGKPPRA